jgi:hypothetical protein
MKKTANKTMARAKFAIAGGSPRGFHEIQTRIDPMSRMDPKPLKKYPKIV